MSQLTFTKAVKTAKAVAAAAAATMATVITKVKRIMMMKSRWDEKTCSASCNIHTLTP